MGPAALPVSLRPHRRSDRRDRARPACPTSTSRCSTCRSRCCGGCGGGATASGSCGASTTSAGARPRPRSAQLHRRLPGRDRGRPRPAAARSSRRPSSTGAGSSPSAREDGTYAAGPRRAGRPGLVAERLAELRELQDAITARRRDALIGATVEVLVDAPGVGAQPPRGARDRRDRRGAAVDLAVGAFSTCRRSSGASGPTSSPTERPDRWRH